MSKNVTIQNDVGTLLPNHDPCRDYRAHYGCDACEHGGRYDYCLNVYAYYFFLASL